MISMKRKRIWPTPRTHKMKKFDVRHIKLTRKEQAIENAMARGEHVSVSGKECKAIAQAITHWRKAQSKAEYSRLAKKLDALKRRATRKTYATTDAVRWHLDRLATSTGALDWRGVDTRQGGR